MCVVVDILLLIASYAVKMDFLDLEILILYTFSVMEEIHKSSYFISFLLHLVMGDLFILAIQVKRHPL